jgi:hypothetical protein
MTTGQEWEVHVDRLTRPTRSRILNHVRAGHEMVSIHGEGGANRVARGSHHSRQPPALLQHFGHVAILPDLEGAERMGMARTQLWVPTASGVARFDAGDEVEVGPERVSRRGRMAVVELENSLEDALAPARPAAQAVLEAFRELAPGEVVVDFGIRIDAEAGAVFAKAGVGAHFNVTLRWTAAGAADNLAERG